MSTTPETAQLDESDDMRDVRDVREENVRSVRLGHGANCSSVGSVIDTLFLGAALGGVVFAAVCAAMKVEGVTVVGAGARKPEAEPEPERETTEEEEGPS